MVKNSQSLHATLLPDMVEFPSFSMHRYARELYRALSALPQEEWTFAETVCHHVDIATKLIPGPVGRNLASRLGRLVRYPRMASRLTGDVFHVLDHSHANLVPALPRQKSVITCHDCIPLLATRGEIPIPATGSQKFFAVRLNMMRKSRRIIAISESTKRDLVRLGQIDPNQIDVVYYGVNEHFNATPKGTASDEKSELLTKLGLPPFARVVLHVNTKNRYKNTPALLNAMAAIRSIKALDDKVWLVRVGAPMFADETELSERLGVHDRVVDAGTVSSDIELAAYYRMADVFAFPSIWEGFGWPPLEAMACSTPVVVSNVSSLPEVVGDAGISVEPADHQGLAKGLADVLTDSRLRADLEARALRRASNFTWTKCAEQTLNVYKRVVESGGQAGR